MSAEPFGDLNREGADASGTARDEDFLSWADAKLIPQRLQSAQRSQRHGGGRCEIETWRHRRRVSLVDAGLFGESAATILCNAREHSIADLEPLDVAADGDDLAG